jgi:hypothetical protein
MKPIVEKNAQGIIDITRILSNFTTTFIVDNIDDVRWELERALNKLSIIDREMYALSDGDNISTQEEIDAVNAHLQSLYGDK